MIWLTHFKAFNSSKLSSLKTQSISSITRQYDYIITGAGCAGLSLVMHIVNDDRLRGKKILLLDKDPKTTNDRTWCFWEKHEGLFQSIVYKEWNNLYLYTHKLTKELEISPYIYKLIKGIDFYNYCLEKIKQYPNVHFTQAVVEDLISNEKESFVLVDGEKIYAQYIFNSIIFKKPNLNSKQYWLLQHFKGWFIEANELVFDSGSATLMDFRIGQEKGTAFFYVLPFSSKTALVEYTLFSTSLLAENEYEEALKNYIEEQLKIKKYAVHQKEFGVIPMTNYSFAGRQNNIINIGTAGGQTKASSGYTFRFIQKHSEGIIKGLAESGDPTTYLHKTKRFGFYDSILLHILYHQQLKGEEIFERLFDKNKADAVLKFLDNETSLREEISIIKSLPTFPFIKAAIKQGGIF